MMPHHLFGGSGPIPAEADCMVAAEQRGMAVPAWDPPTEDRHSWRVVFARKDGTALLLTETWFSDHLSADVYPTVGLALAVSWDAPPAGYGSIPYALGWRWLDALLDRFRDWDGGDVVGALTDRLPSGPGGSCP